MPVSQEVKVSLSVNGEVPHTVHTSASSRSYRGTDDDEDLGSRSVFWVLGALILYAVPLAAGVCQFDGKWTQVDGWSFTKSDVDPSVTVDCTEDPYSFNPPCYFGLQQEATYITIWLLPFAPFLIAGAAALCSSSGGAGEAACRRLISYALLVGLFFLVNNLRPDAQAAFGTTADPSEQVTASIVGLTIAFAEVGVSGQKWLQWLVSVAALLVLLLKAYFSYFTALYFQSPLETELGFGEGLVLSLLYLILSDSCCKTAFCRDVEPLSEPLMAQRC